MTRPVFRRGTGPAIVVIHEIPGITPEVADFGRRVADAGFTAVLPALFGEPGKPMTVGYVAKSFFAGCVSKEFHAWALHSTSPITVWLRALGAQVHEECGGPGIGAVGMCFTGNFALAMMVDDRLLAPVLSQPSLPLPLGSKREADLAISPGDLEPGQGAGRRRHLRARAAVHRRPRGATGAVRDAAARARRRVPVRRDRLVRAATRTTSRSRRTRC